MTILRRTLLAGAAVLAGTLALAPSAWAQAANEIVIGLTMAKSGPLKTPAEATETAVDIAVAEINAAGGINGKPIKLIKFDTASDPRQAATAAQKFAQDDAALAIIGPFSSGEAAVAFPVGERLGIVQLPNAASQPGLTGNFSYAWRLTEDEGKQFGRLLQTLKRKNIKADKAEILFISDERISNVTATTLYPALLKRENIAFGEPISFQYRTFDLAPQVAQIMQRNPDVVALAATPDGANKVLKELNGKASRAASSARRSSPIRTRWRTSGPRATACSSSRAIGGTATTPPAPSPRSSRRKTPSAGSIRRRSRTTRTRRPMTASICSRPLWRRRRSQATRRRSRKSAPPSATRCAASASPASRARTPASMPRATRSFPASSSRSRT
jgi:hypothetical protein